MADLLKEEREEAAKRALLGESESVSLPSSAPQRAYNRDQAELGTRGYGPSPNLRPGDQVFPTKHPYAPNPTGKGTSNVILSGNTGDDGRIYAFPQMVGGEYLGEKRGWELAKKIGLEKYPSFATGDELNVWAEKHHARIDPEGRLTAEDYREPKKEED